MICYYGIASFNEFSTFIPVVMSHKMSFACKLLYNVSVYISLKNNNTESNVEYWFLKLVLSGILYIFSVMMDVKIYAMNSDPNSGPGLVLIHTIYYIYHFSISKSISQSTFKKIIVFIFTVTLVFNDLIKTYESV